MFLLRKKYKRELFSHSACRHGQEQWFQIEFDSLSVAVGGAMIAKLILKAAR